MPSTTASIERLFDIAESDTGQGRCVANFLLAWWNAGSCGGFDLTDLWNVDRQIARDMTVMFAMIGEDAERSYPAGFEDRFRNLVRRWRPDLLKGEMDEVSA